MAEFSGHLLLGAERRDDGQTMLARQSFRAPYHVSKSYWDAEAKALMVQVVNPTAGILSGDRLELDITAGAGAALLMTTPSASRVFKMTSGEAMCAQRFTVAAGGWLEFLPEPLVPHRDSHYRQTTEIAVAEGGELLFADFLLAGRIARGERWAWSRLRLELAVRVGGDLVLRERFDHSGAALKALAELAGTESGACFGNIVLVSPRLTAGAAEWRSELARLHGDGVWIGASELRGGKAAWTLKIVAPDGGAMRRTLVAAREILARHLRAELRRV
jgi:urease accessory protein